MLASAPKNSPTGGASGGNTPLSYQRKQTGIAETTTLLKRRGLAHVPLFFFFYCFLLALLGAFQFYFRNAPQTCSSGEGKDCDSKLAVGFRNEQYEYASWVRDIQIFTTGCFCISTSLQVVRIVGTRVQGKDQSGIVEGYLAVLAVNVIAGISTYTTFLCHLGGICRDIYGVVFPAGTWPEWTCSVPLLVYICLSLDVKQAFDREDALVIAAVFSMIIFGALLCTATSPISFWIFMFLSCISMLSVYRILWSSTTNLQLIIGASSWLQQTSGDYNFRVLLAKRKRTLSICVACLFPSFPITYFLALMGVIGPNETFASIMIAGCVTKILFASLCCDAHQEVSHPAFILLDLERISNMSRRAFLRYVFHEVRVPLNSLSMGSQLLKATAADQEIVGMMCEAAMTMGETLNDVLALQKIEEGAIKLSPTPFYLDELVSSIQEDYQDYADNRNVTIITQNYLAFNIKVVLDKFRFRHVLCSLVSNAIKFSFRGGRVTIKVEIIDTPTYEGDDKSNQKKAGGSEALPQCPKQLVVSVTDLGKGVPESKVEYLFTPYLVTRPGELQQGRSTGIGLAICKEIISLHDGIITCTSEGLNKGSTFAVTVPIKIVESTEPRVLASARLQGAVSAVSAAGGSEPPKFAHMDLLQRYSLNPSASQEEVDKQAKVLSSNSNNDSNSGVEASDAAEKASKSDQLHALIVEDVLSNRKMLNKLLTVRNIHSSMAEDGRIGYEAVKAKPLDYFDLIFMDNTMPNMTGMECSKALRALGYEKMIIGVTGNSMEEELAEFRKCGADLVLTKPLSIACLDLLIAHIKENGNKSVPSEKLFIDGEKLIIVPSKVNMGVKK